MKTTTRLQKITQTPVTTLIRNMRSLHYDCGLVTGSAVPMMSSDQRLELLEYFRTQYRPLTLYRLLQADRDQWSRTGTQMWPGEE
jgi:hypothetical protein